MQDFMKHFKREQDGVWSCITTASIGSVTIPSGARIKVGTTFDGVDVGQLLEQEYARKVEDP
jgi:hypothetical protein